MARNKKAKEYASLAAQTAATDGGTVAPHSERPDPIADGPVSTAVATVQPLEPWVAGDLKLRQLAQRIESDYFAFCAVAQIAMAENWHQKFGFVDASAYFDERVGLSYRTVRRRLTILEAIQRLPEGEQEEAKVTMTALGSKKAAVLAPMLGKPDLDWKAAATFAQGVNEAAVQSMVSEKLGHPHRGLPASQHPGDRFLAYLLNIVPPDEHDRVESAFNAGFKVTGSRNAMAVFLAMVNCFIRDLADSGIVIDA
jgi:hypothetical protein